MSRPAALLQIDEVDVSPALAQARAWVKKISATEKARFIDRAQAFRDKPSRHRTNEAGLRKTILAIADLFPWPSNEALRSAAEKRLERLVGGSDPHDAVLAYELILDLLENPDALLG